MTELIWLKAVPKGAVFCVLKGKNEIEQNERGLAGIRYTIIEKK
jgi:hypothetical protein